MRLKTRLTELAGIEHPVVQTGMGWVAGARLVSATSNAGGLGILASATMTIDELAVAITKVKASTDRPFGVNIRADAADAADRVGAIRIGCVFVGQIRVRSRLRPVVKFDPEIIFAAFAILRGVDNEDHKVCRHGCGL